MIYPFLSLKFMKSGLNVPIIQSNAQRNLDQFLIDNLSYQITIDAQLKFPLFPVKTFLSTALFCKMYILYPT